jgi:hypothetical protein
MAVYGIGRRLLALERQQAATALVCADTLAEWERRLRAAGDPDGLLAAAEATVRKWKEAREVWQPVKPKPILTR